MPNVAGLNWLLLSDLYDQTIDKSMQAVVSEATLRTAATIASWNGTSIWSLHLQS
jgi:hypothetical protein